jgi:hypothetical protein
MAWLVEWGLTSEAVEQWSRDDDTRHAWRCDLVSGNQRN